jgi:hypothetical protein
LSAFHREPFKTRSESHLIDEWAAQLIEAAAVIAPTPTTGAAMATTQKYCSDCEKGLDKQITAEREFMDASVFRPSTDAAGHVHQTQYGTCDKCGKSKVVSFYELWSEQT